MIIDYYERLDISSKEKLEGWAFSALDGSGAIGGEIHGFSLRVMNIDGKVIDIELAGELDEYLRNDEVQVPLQEKPSLK
jgi:hypothetical protein